MTAKMRLEIEETPGVVARLLDGRCLKRVPRARVAPKMAARNATICLGHGR